MSLHLLKPILVDCRPLSRTQCLLFHRIRASSRKSSVHVSSWKPSDHLRRCCSTDAFVVASDDKYGNKQVISVNPRLYDYILGNVREPEILRKLREETATMRGSQMQVSPDQGQLLSMLVQILGAKRCIEVGVYTGYSSLAIALVLPESGCLVACERDEKALEVAARYYEQAGVLHKVHLKCGLAKDTLKFLLENGEASRAVAALVVVMTMVWWCTVAVTLEAVVVVAVVAIVVVTAVVGVMAGGCDWCSDWWRQWLYNGGGGGECGVVVVLVRNGGDCGDCEADGSLWCNSNNTFGVDLCSSGGDDGEGGNILCFDFAFVDAEKKMYPEYFELLLQLVRVGGIIVIDNVLWHGKVADPLVNDAKTASIRNFNKALMEDERVDISMVPIGDGMTICRKR